MKILISVFSFSIILLPALADEPSHVSLSQQDQQKIERQIQSTKDFPVPLPKKTPFDSDPKARKVYLETFKQSYRMAMAGFFPTCCMEKWTYMKAEGSGHDDGQAQAIKDHPEILSEDHLTKP